MSVTLAVTGALALWFVLVLILGTSAAFVRPPGELPLPILGGATIPIILFFAAFYIWRPFREFVLALDLRLVTGIHAWRAGGLGFLALYTHGLLPGSFALPAGLGDIAIGVSAPWMMLALIRRPSFATSRLFTLWNLLGLLDLVVAVGTGVLNSGLVPGAVAEVTTAPMAQLPLVLIPAYLVPLFIMLHLAALFQVRALALSTRPNGLRVARGDYFSEARRLRS